jgi:hypothetical protein
MHFRVALAAFGALLAIRTTVAAAQTGDRARLVFTVSGAYIGGKGLWTVPNQFVDANGLGGNLVLSRSIQSTLGASFAGTYYPGNRLGITAEAFLVGLGYDDACRITTPDAGVRLVEVCRDIDTQEKSAAAVALSVGGIFRIASRDFISPYARASAGLLITNQSSLLTQGVSPSFDGALLVLYEDDSRTGVRPAFGLGVGATMVLSKGYHLRWEVRDNILGVRRVTGPTALPGMIPPHETAYRHLFSALIGIDIILERQRGRRY